MVISSDLDDLDVSSLTESMDLQFTTIEAALNCPIFNKLYNINKSLSRLSFSSEDYDAESDDSYAAKFGECIRKITVYTSSRRVSLESLDGGLFRVVVLRNRKTKFSYVFLVKINHHDRESPECKDDELWLWWMNDDEDSKLESKDQILNINGVYLDNISLDFKLALSFLKTKRTDNNNDLNKLELIVSRNINKRLIKKNHKKPKLISNSFIGASSSTSSLSSCSIRSDSSLPTHTQSLLLYNLNNDNLRISSFFPESFTYNSCQMTYQDMMVLNTEWTQLESIELLNETISGSSSLGNGTGTASNSLSLSSKSSSFGSGSGGGGFGFGITGNKSTGVVVKAITPGGSASKDARLRINDQIFQIGDINVRSMSSEQVASVLRQSSMQGQYVKFIVARPVHNSVNDIELLDLKPSLTSSNPNTQCYLIKTSDIMDKKVDLQKLIASELEQQLAKPSQADTMASITTTTTTTQILNEYQLTESDLPDIDFKRNNSMSKQRKQSSISISTRTSVTLDENNCFTIEFLNCTSSFKAENLIEFLNQSLSTHLIQFDLDFENLDKILYIKTNSSKTYSSIEIYDQLIEVNQHSVQSLLTSATSLNDLTQNPNKLQIKLIKNVKFKLKKLSQKWLNYLSSEPEYNDMLNFNLEIITSRIDKTKSKSLGISLEGTVDLDDQGKETYPHHYIRSIMSQGPVENSLDAKFEPGDELLEIDSTKLYAINYLDLLDHLKSLQNKITILICARKTKKCKTLTKRAKSECFLGKNPADNSSSESPKDPLSNSQNLALTSTKSTPILSVLTPPKNLIKPPTLSTSNPKQIRTPQLCIRSRSLELNGLALWNKKVNYISLVKSDKGLGFSLIDYQQDPFNPMSKTMIVIRALVPNGVAQHDGRLVPGQRLVSINDVVLDEDLLSTIDSNASRVSTLSLAFNNQHKSSTNISVNLLKFTVDTLKSLPIGQIVRLGVQKPLPYPDADPSLFPSSSNDSLSNETLEMKPKHRSYMSLNKTVSNTNTPKLRKKKTENYKIITASQYDLEDDRVYENEMYLNDHEFEEAMQYGFVATSAPAILNQDMIDKEKQTSDSQSYPFYSSSSLLKLNTLNLHSHVCELSSSKNNSTVELKFEGLKDDELNMSTSTPKSQIKSCIKGSSVNKSASMPISEVMETRAENEAIAMRLANSVKYLDYLLGNGIRPQDKDKDKDRDEMNDCKLLTSEEQFNQAFVLNTNKKLINLIETNQIQNNCVQENTTNQYESDNHCFRANTNHQNEITHKTKQSKNPSKKYLNEMIRDIANFNWPEPTHEQEIDTSIISKHIEDTSKSQLQFEKDSVKNSAKTKRKSRNFDEQRKFISKSRSPSGARSYYTDKNDKSAHRVRSISHGQATSNKYLLSESRGTSTSQSHSSSRSSSVKIVNILGKEIVKLPGFLEREIKIKKNFHPLGISSVDCCSDEGINGCVILRIDPNSACAKDNRLKIGDYLLSVNNEQMRNLTNSSARAILNRASLTSKDVVIIYISYADALEFKANLSKMSCNLQSPSRASSMNTSTCSLSSSDESSSENCSTCSSNTSSASCSSYSLNRIPQPSKFISTLTVCDSLMQDSSHFSLSNAIKKSHTTERIKEKRLLTNQHQSETSKSSTKLKTKRKNLKTSKHHHHCHCNHHQDPKPPNDTEQSNPTSFLSTINQEDTLIQATMSCQNRLNSPIDIASSLWGQPRLIVLSREPNKSLGISIVGGKLDVCSSNNSTVSSSGSGLLTSSSISQINSFISGIFIKHVLENSPAGLNGTLKTGDRILAVNDIDLTQATHDRAVEVIRNAKSPVKFLIQSLVCASAYTPSCDEDIVNTASVNKIEDEEESEPIDPLKQVVNETNKYNYSLEMIKEKYNYLLEPNIRNRFFIFKLRRVSPNESLGLSLSGNVNLNKTSVFVCGIYNSSIADKHGLIRTGDQILEINGQSIYGRAHSNVTPLIKNMKDLDVYLVVLRSSDSLTQMFKPLLQSSISQSQSESRSVSPSPNCSKTPNELSSPITELSSIANSSLQTEDIKNLTVSSVLAQSSRQIRKISLKKGPTGFGIAISEDRHNRLIVRGLNSNGIAFHDGRMQVGDEILAVNDLKVNSMKYDDVMNLLHLTQEPVEFQVSKPEVITACSSSVQSLHGSNNASCSASSSASPQITLKQANKEVLKPKPTVLDTVNQNIEKPLKQTEPKTNQIKVGEETWIEIERGKLGLGLSIVGGSDTQLPGIIIHDIYQNGAAYRDKRLAIGDQILKVNNIDLINATHEQALNALRQTSDFVKLLIHRGFQATHQTEHLNSINSKNSLNDPSSSGSAYSFTGLSGLDDEKFLNIIIVELNKKFAKGLGFSIIGRRDGSGVFISHIIEGGCAHKDSRLMIGDLILEVNGQDIRRSAYSDVAFLLKTLPQGKVSLKVGRFKTSAGASAASSVSTSANVSASASKTTSRRNSNCDLSIDDTNGRASMPNVSTFRTVVKK